MADLFQRLHDDVVSGVLDPGEPLVEATLARRYGVSRTPVREALNRLEHDGLIERGHRSLRVRTRTPTEILEIYEVRITLEGLAARQAALHRTDLDLHRLRRAHEAMVALAPGAAPDERAVVNRAYHEAVWAAGHNADPRGPAAPAARPPPSLPRDHSLGGWPVGGRARGAPRAERADRRA